jgi:hypothetical protein
MFSHLSLVFLPFSNLQTSRQPIKKPRRLICCYIVFYLKPTWSLYVWKWRKYKAQTDWWENVKSPYWILTPFWITIFGPKEVPKCLLQQVQNKFICWIRLRNSCVKAKRKKNSGWWRHLYLIRHFEVWKRSI